MKLTLCVPCLFGLEGLTADELKYMGCGGVRAETGRVLFTGEERDLVRANLLLRTGERVYVLLGNSPLPALTSSLRAPGPCPGSSSSTTGASSRCGAPAWTAP